MSWTIERRGRVAVVTMTTNTANGGHEATRVHTSPVSAQTQLRARPTPRKRTG